MNNVADGGHAMRFSVASLVAVVEFDATSEFVTRDVAGNKFVSGYTV